GNTTTAPLSWATRSTVCSVPGSSRRQVLSEYDVPCTQWKTDRAPRAAAAKATALVTSTARRSTSGCSGPDPDRVSTRTSWPALASCAATVHPTGPAPVTTWRSDIGVLLGVLLARVSGCLQRAAFSLRKQEHC